MNNKSSLWQLKGEAPVIYDKHIAPAVSAQWYNLLIKASLPYANGCKIADFACGTGNFIRFLLTHTEIPVDAELIGIDLNDKMLSIAKENQQSDKYNVRWLKSDINDLPLPTGYLDIAYCQQGIQYFSDKNKGMKEIYRTLDNQGIFIATVWSDIEDCVGYKLLADATLNVVGNLAEKNLYAPFNYSNQSLLSSLCKKAGFDEIEIKLVDNVVCFNSIHEFVWNRILGSPILDDINDDDIESVISQILLQLSHTLRAYENEDGLRFPVKSNFLIAKKSE